MKLLPIKGKERARVACLADELDEVVGFLRWLFAGRCKVKVAISGGIAVVVVI